MDENPYQSPHAESVSATPRKQITWRRTLSDVLFVAGAGFAIYASLGVISFIGCLIQGDFGEATPAMIVTLAVITAAASALLVGIGRRVRRGPR
jgi:hypothetical protein